MNGRESWLERLELGDEGGRGNPHCSLNVPAGGVVFGRIRTAVLRKGDGPAYWDIPYMKKKKKKYLASREVPIPPARMKHM